MVTYDAVLPPRGRDGKGTGAVTAPAARSTAWPAVVVLVWVVAFAARLVPVLRGGGLFGLGNYDDGVYFTAAVGLAHGLVPYRDFLLLHPPGIVLVLLPFAALGRLVGEADAFAAARMAFMALGATNAVLVAALVRRASSAGPALVGGLCFALAQPAVFTAHSTLLETPAATCLLLALVLLRPGASGHRGSPWSAGFLLGVAAATKIWGVEVLAVVVLWSVVTAGWRRALRVAGGGLAGAAAVCLPFLAVAGPVMWRMVVLDQLARGGSDAAVPVRVADLLGLHDWQPQQGSWTAATLVAAVAVVLCVVLACRSALGRLAVALLVATTGLLLVVPSWYVHYPGLSAAPLALVVGTAVAAVSPAHRRRRLAAVGLATVLVVLLGLPTVTTGTFGRRFPAGALRAAVVGRPGCVTSDDPTTLVELGVLDPDIEHRCPLVVDLTGYSYDLRPAGHRLTRRENPAWQQNTLDYLESGTSTLVVRLDHAYGLTARSARTIAGWRAVACARGFRVQVPTP